VSPRCQVAARPGRLLFIDHIGTPATQSVKRAESNAMSELERPSGLIEGPAPLPTSLVPLTTLWTKPASCSTHFTLAGPPNTPGVFIRQHDESCRPAFYFEVGGTYSPGLCPIGYTTWSTSTLMEHTPAITGAMCCPRCVAHLWCRRPTIAAIVIAINCVLTLPYEAVGMTDTELIVNLFLRRQFQQSSSQTIRPW